MKFIDSLEYTEDYNVNAERLRGFIKTGLLHYTDLNDHPHKFMESHHLFGKRAVELGPGIMVRFTV